MIFAIFLISIVAGAFGSILGLGGGVVIVPALTLLFHVPIRYAVGASIVSVIATSSGAAATYVRDHVTNIRIAMLLEVATTLGALGGAMLSALIPSRYLFILFAVVLLYSAVIMLRTKRTSEALLPEESDSWAKHLKLASSYPDAALRQEVHYGVKNVPEGMGLMLGAGVISGLLGIGSGALKVPAMDTAMHLPIKVSSATSNFMIGVTAAASAGAYYVRGDIQPRLAAPVALGVLIGAWVGTRLMMRMHSNKIRKLFIGVLVIIAIQMALKAAGVEIR
ncbi:sulfite exporter TauE/SafE family protein [Candidatus Peregrinibacteria bacterium]|nr:sulfite exporter TauE/SafE family protein [Candidatus Peregrinibacteria bacterium]